MEVGDIVKINWESEPTLDGKIGKIFLIESNGEYVHIEICDETWHTVSILKSRLSIYNGSSYLNLCKLLKDYIGHTFYHIIYGDVVLESVDGCLWFTNGATLYSNGWRESNDICHLYPSKEYYMKYMFNHKKAWEVWISEIKN